MLYAYANNKDPDQPFIGISGAGSKHDPPISSKPLDVYKH